MLMALIDFDHQIFFMSLAFAISFHVSSHVTNAYKNRRKCKMKHTNNRIKRLELKKCFSKDTVKNFFFINLKRICYWVLKYHDISSVTIITCWMKAPLPHLYIEAHQTTVKAHLYICAVSRWRRPKQQRSPSPPWAREFRSPLSSPPSGSPRGSWMSSGYRGTSQESHAGIPCPVRKKNAWRELIMHVWSWIVCCFCCFGWWILLLSYVLGCWSYRWIGVIVLLDSGRCGCMFMSKLLLIHIQGYFISPWCCMHVGYCVL